MTNEEIEVEAGIYTKEKHCKNGCKNIPNCWENDIEDCCIDCRKTNEDFIAGAKWGIKHTIEYHDLRKNPSDMPKETKDYIIYHEDNTGFHHYSIRRFSHNYFECTNTVIAWCELPQFKG